MYLNKGSFNSLRLSHTSAGVLCKWIFLKDGTIYYAKSGSINKIGLFTDRQPLAEVMAYRLGVQLGFKNVIDTRLFKLHLDKTDSYEEQDIDISCTKNFLNNGENYIGMHRYFSKQELIDNTSNLYDTIISKFPFIESDINCMIIFDFIIFNIDRHLNNFGLIEKDNRPYKFSPLFDNGLSLFSYFSDEELSKLSNFHLDKKLKTKPFNANSYKQIKLINLDKIRLDLKLSLLNAVIDWDIVFKDLNLSEFRKSKIKALVEVRLRYVKDLLS